MAENKNEFVPNWQHCNLNTILLTFNILDSLGFICRAKVSGMRMLHKGPVLIILELKRFGVACCVIERKRQTRES